MCINVSPEVSSKGNRYTVCPSTVSQWEEAKLLNSCYMSCTFFRDLIFSTCWWFTLLRVASFAADSAGDWPAVSVDWDPVLVCCLLLGVAMSYPSLCSLGLTLESPPPLPHSPLSYHHLFFNLSNRPCSFSFSTARLTAFLETIKHTCKTGWATYQLSVYHSLILEIKK